MVARTLCSTPLRTTIASGCMPDSNNYCISFSLLILLDSVVGWQQTLVQWQLWQHLKSELQCMHSNCFQLPRLCVDRTDGLGMRLRLPWSHSQTAMWTVQMVWEWDQDLPWSHFHTLIVYVLHSMRGIYDDGYLVTSDLRPGLGHEE